MTTTAEGTWQTAYTEGRARRYDEFIRLGAMNYDGVLDAVLKSVMAPRTQPMRVLELGAGTGLLSERLLAEFPRAELTAVDGSAEMLSRAEERLAPFGGRVRLMRASFEDLFEWSLGRFDLCVSSFALHHMDHAALRRGFSRLADALSSGGQLVVADYVLTGHPRLQERYEDIWVATRVENARRAHGTELDFAAVKREHEATKAAEGDNPARLGDILRWLDAAGFVETECHWKHFCYAVYGGRA